MALSRTNLHRYLYIGFLGLLGASLPLSAYMMSVFQFLIIINWVAEGKLRNKIQLLKENRLVFVLPAVLLIHVIWLLNTTEYHYAWNDIRIKLPLLSIPIIIGTTPFLSSKELKIVLGLFIAGTLAASIGCTLTYLGLTSHEVNNIRDISIYISHIRFALLINIAIFLSGYFIIKEKLTLIRISLAGGIIWLAFFLLILQSLTGWIVLFISSIILFIIYRKSVVKKWIRFSVYILLILMLGYAVTVIISALDRYYPDSPVSFAELPRSTASGNVYNHDFNNPQIENGNYVGLNICKKELSEEWKEIAGMEIDDLDERGNKLRYTLIRYMTSKGLDKDSAGVHSLTEKDISAIKSGIPNAGYLNKFAPDNIVYRVIWQIDQYIKTGEASGNSVTQRIEYLKAGFRILSGNLWFGVGTGDLKSSFADEYESMNSKLKPEFRHRAHNQFLTFLIAFGLIGGILVISLLLFPVLLNRRANSFFIWMFSIIAFISMFNEDTLETQAGITFFVFFYSIFVLHKNFSKKTDI